MFVHDIKEVFSKWMCQQKREFHHCVNNEYLYDGQYDGHILDIWYVSIWCRYDGQSKYITVFDTVISDMDMCFNTVWDDMVNIKVIMVNTVSKVNRVNINLLALLRTQRERQAKKQLSNMSDCL